MITPQEIIMSQLLTTSEATYYTVPARIPKMQVTKLNLNNVSAGNVIVNVWIVPVGGSTSDENNVIKDKNILPTQNYSSGEARKLLKTGYFIVAKASAADAVNISANGNAIT